LGFLNLAAELLITAFCSAHRRRLAAAIRALAGGRDAMFASRRSGTLNRHSEQFGDRGHVEQFFQV
jgi:hypothetical protein